MPLLPYGVGARTYAHVERVVGDRAATRDEVDTSSSSSTPLMYSLAQFDRLSSVGGHSQTSAAAAAARRAISNFLGTPCILKSTSPTTLRRRPFCCQQVAQIS